MEIKTERDIDIGKKIESNQIVSSTIHDFNYNRVKKDIMNNTDYIFTIAITLAIGITLLGYWIKYTLKQNGYEVRWLSSHLTDIPNIWRLAKRTENPTLKRRYYLMALGLSTISIIFLVFILLNIL